MSERAIRQALRRLGTRAETLGTCPVCGRKVRPGHDHLRAWSGTFAHRECVSYQRRPKGRGRHSQRVHQRFTAA